MPSGWPSILPPVVAIALAIRPTLENLIGGVILYVDKPVRIGDYCTFGDQGGRVEAIGIRSTKLRALDQTLISVPNAEFANMQINNWSHNDFLISRVIGLRYETDLDQLDAIETALEVEACLAALRGIRELSSAPMVLISGTFSGGSLYTWAAAKNLARLGERAGGGPRTVAPAATRSRILRRISGRIVSSSGSTSRRYVVPCGCHGSRLLERES